MSKKKAFRASTLGQDCWIEWQSNHNACCLNEARVRPHPRFRENQVFLHLYGVYGQ